MPVTVYTRECEYVSESIYGKKGITEPIFGNMGIVDIIWK